MSYNFILLQTGHELQNFSSKTITNPDHQLQIPVGRGRQLRTIYIPGQTETVPTNIPDGMGPLTLPGDFNQTINNQFCFLLENNGSENLSLNMKALNNYDVANITQDTQGNTALLNASDNIMQNTWYNVTQTISHNQITTRLTDANGTLIGTMSTGSSGMALLVANNVDSAVVFKNLKYCQISDNPDNQPQTITPTPIRSPQTVVSNEWYLPYVVFTIALISGLSLTFLLNERRTRKKAQNKN